MVEARGQQHLLQIPLCISHMLRLNPIQPNIGHQRLLLPTKTNSQLKIRTKEQELGRELKHLLLGWLLDQS